jgi:two-component system cell cycle sensor histidine kinase/response regulator CckA
MELRSTSGNSPTQSHLIHSERILRSFHEISSNTDLSTEDQIQAILDLGCRHLGLPIGIVSERKGPLFEVIAAIDPKGMVDKGAQVPAEEAFCRETMEVDRTFSFEHASASDWRKHPAYSGLKQEAYLGLPIRVGRSGKGTLSFSSREPRKAPYEPFDQAVLELLAQRVEVLLEQMEMDRRLKTMLAGISPVSGQAFFDALVKHLAEALQVQYAIVTECTDVENACARTLAFWNDQRTVENIEYSVGATPCADVLKGKKIFHGHNIQELFPEDQFLADMNVASYLGMPVLDSSGSVIGHLVAMDTKPMPPSRESDWIVDLFAARAGSELERYRYDRKLREAEERYELATASAKVGVWDRNLLTGNVYLDPNIKAILGYADDEIRNDPGEWDKHIYVEDKALVQREYERHLEGNSTDYSVEYRMLHKDGSPRWILSRGRAIRNQEGSPIRMVGTNTDITERRQSEERLRESEERYRDLFEESLDLIQVLAPTGRILYVNPAWRKALGYGEERISGLFLQDITHPEDKQHCEDLLARLNQGEYLDKIETRIVSKTGKTLEVENSCSVKKVDGRVTSIRCILRDVTRRKRLWRAMKALAEEGVGSKGAEFFPAMVRQLASAFNSKYAFVSELAPPEYERLRVLALWESGKPSKPFEYGVKGTPCEQAFTQGAVIFQNGVSSRFSDVDWIREAGIESYAAVSFHDGDGKPMGLVGIMHDVPIEEDLPTTDLLKVFAAQASAELQRDHSVAALKETEERLKATFEHANVGIAHVDMDLRFINVNPRFTEFLGYSVEELTGLKVNDVTHPDDIVRNIDLFKRARQGEINTYQMEKRYIRKDKTIVWGSLSVSVVFGVDGNPLYLIGVLNDITSRKEAEEEQRKFESQVQQTQKLESLGVLAGGIAHDFNNLLTGILGNASLAGVELQESSNTRKLLGEIETSALRAAELTSQLLAYAGKGRFVISSLSLNKLAAEMADLLGAAVSKKAVFEHHYAEHLPPVEADATQIRQVVMNLITNASDALGEGTGKITLSTGTISSDNDAFEGAFPGTDAPRGTYVYLEVSDTGAGMPEDIHHRIFDPFFSTKFTGRGLGLAAVLGIVRSHRGFIKVKSRPGEGSTITVLLPASREATLFSDVTPPPSVTWSGSGTILLVDDEPTVVNVAKAMIEKTGFQVLIATNGLEGVEMLKKHAEEITAVVLDMTMPVLDGESALGEMLKIRPDLKVLMSSGYDEQDATRKLHGKRLVGFIKKPFLFPDMVSKLRKAIESG